MPNTSRVKLGDFTIVKKIGEGGMGTVYMARQESLERMVALKILPRQFSENPEFVERFRREARAAASLVHPNVVQIYHVGEERGVHYFAMEYVEGQSLEGLMAEGRRFEVDEALDTAMHVARALDAAAEKGIVHRDIKPANVMVDRKGVVKVMDFGLAKPSGELNNITQPGLVVGTPAYMSPEQGEGSEVDCRSDIYSLGMVLYKLLTGVVPFTGDNPGTVIYKHLHEAPKPPSEVNPRVPAKVDALVLKCLAKKPDERFSNAAEMLSAIARIRSGETQTDPTIMMSGKSRSSSEPTMALPARSGRDLTPPTIPPSALAGAQAAAQPGAQTPPPGVVSGAYPPVGAGGGRWVLVAVAALVLLATGLGFGAAYYLRKSPDGAGAGNAPSDKPPVAHGPAVTEPDPNPAVKEPASNPADAVVVAPGPEPKAPDEPVAVPEPRPVPAACTLGLSALGEKLPRGAEATLLLPSGERQSLGNVLRDVGGLAAGDYTLSIRRTGYEDLAVKLHLSAAGVEPALSTELLKFSAAPELSDSYGNAEKLMTENPGHKELLEALGELDKVCLLDPGYKETQALRGRAQKLLAEEKKRWDDAFAGADDLYKERQWAKARDGFGALPVWHERYRDARELMIRADENDGKVKAALAGLREGLDRGRLREAGEDLAVLERLAARDPEVEKLSASLAAARKAWDGAEADFEARRYAEAREKYGRVVALCPNCREAAERGAACDKLIALAASANKGLAQAEAMLAAGKYSECLAALAGLKAGLSADDQKRLGELRSLAEKGQEQERVDRQLAAFDAAFAKGEVDSLARFLDRTGKGGDELAIALQRDAREFFGSGLAVESSRHEIGEFNVIERAEDGAPVKAQARASWKFSLRLGEVGKTVTGSVPQAIDLSCVRGVWLISKMAPNGKIEMAAAGERPAAAGRVTGRVRDVEGEAVIIDRGSDHGVSGKTVFDIFAEAKVVRLPLSGDAPVFVEEHPVAAVEVVKVERESARCAFLAEVTPEARRKVKKGMLAASSLVRRGVLTAPVIAGHAVEPKEARVAAGRELTLSLEVPAIEGSFLTYEWSADGGLLSAPRTAGPRVTWTAPAEARSFKITATAVSSRGERSAPHVIEVQSSGVEAQPPASYDLLGRICGADFLEHAADVAFDETGRACVLDTGLRRVLVLDPEFRVTAVSGRWPAEFTRLAARGDVLYCLDSRGCAVKRFSLSAADPFTKPLAPDVGARGEGNGRLRNPVDLAVSPAGELLVLDAQPEAASVQVFTAEGAFVTSFGWGGAGAGALREPVAIDVDLSGAVYVLDTATRKVVVFRAGRPAGSFECADKTGKPVDLSCDASTDGVLVLDANFKQVASFSTSGERRADRSLGLTAAGPGELAGALRLAASRAGLVLAVSGEGRHLDRFSVSGAFLGRLGGELFGSSVRVAASPAGECLALDCKSGLIRRIDARGWVLSEFAGGKTFDEPADIACDSRGTIYVLDAGVYSVLAFDAAGKPAGKIGSKERPPAGLDDAVALAALRGDFVAVACDWKEKAFVRANLEKQEFSALGLTTAKPRFIAVDAAETVYAAGSSGQVERLTKDGAKGSWTAAFKGLTGLEACGSAVFALDSREKAALLCNPQTGEVLSRTAQFPEGCSEPRDLAASAYETIFVFDASTRSLLAFRAKR